MQDIKYNLNRFSLLSFHVFSSSSSISVEFSQSHQRNYRGLPYVPKKINNNNFLKDQYIVAHRVLVQGVGQFSLSRSILVHQFILKRGRLDERFFWHIIQVFGWT